MSDHTTPPDAISAYHAPWLEAAAAGRLRYDTDTYRIHGLPNNAVACIWQGLLADAPTGPVLTELGARLLAEWRAAHPGHWAVRATPPLPEPAPAAPAMPGGYVQPDLFADA